MMCFATRIFELKEILKQIKNGLSSRNVLSKRTDFFASNKLGIISNFLIYGSNQFVCFTKMLFYSIKIFLRPISETRKFKKYLLFIKGIWLQFFGKSFYIFKEDHKLRIFRNDRTCSIDFPFGRRRNIFL